MANFLEQSRGRLPMLTDSLVLILWFVGLQANSMSIKGWSTAVLDFPLLTGLTQLTTQGKEDPIPLLGLDKGNRGLTFQVSNHRKNCSVTGL
jgi:hypothetical protein